MTQSITWNMYPAGVTAAGRTGTVNVPLYPQPWVFAGRACTIEQFADHIWPEPCADKTHFVLKWQGRQPQL